MTEYTFDLDIKEENRDRENERLRREDKERKRNPLYMNMENFFTYRMQALIFLIDFPLTYLMRMLDIWHKIVPQEPRPSQWDRYELQGIE